MQKIRRLFNMLVVCCVLYTSFVFGLEVYKLRKELAEPEAQAMINSRGEQVVIEDGPPMDSYDANDAVDMNALLEKIHLKKYNIDPRISRAILHMESGGRMDTIRFEPSYLKRAKEISKNEYEQRQISSSLCAFQVMGTWPYTLNKKLGTKWTWADLYRPSLCAEMSALIIKLCAKESQGKDNYDRAWKIFRCYNGSADYADKAMAVLNREIFRSANLKLPYGEG